VAKSIVYGSLPTPTLASVLESARFALNVTLEVRHDYALCAMRRDRECNDSFYKDLTTEVTRSQNVLNNNRIRLNNYTDIRLTCVEHFGAVILALDYMQNTKMVPYDPDFLTVFAKTDPQASTVCNNVAQTLQDQVAAIHAGEQAELYQQNSQERVGFLTSTIDAQAAYNDEYVSNLTGGLQLAGTNLQQYNTDPNAAFNNMAANRDRWIACSSASGQYNGQTCPGPTLIQRIDSMRKGAVDMYDNNVQAFKVFRDSIYTDYAPLFSFYTNFKNAMANEGIASAVASAIGGDLYSVLGFDADVSGELPSMSVPPTSQYSANIPTTAPLAAQNAQDSTSLIAKQGAVQAQAQADSAALATQQVSWINGFFDDYNPPTIDTNATKNGFFKESSKFLPELEEDLNLVARAVRPAQQDNFQPDTNTTVSGRTAHDLLRDNPVRDFDVYLYDIDLLQLLALWHSITGITLNMDYIYRALRSYQTVMRYWRISEVLAPPADVRQKGILKKGQIKKDARTPDQKMMDLLTNPATTLLLALIFIGVVAGVFLQTYLVLYTEYVTGCVYGSYEGRGTMLTRNGAVVMFGVAAQYGDSIEQTSKDRINTQRQLECSKNQDRTFKQQKLFRQEYLWDVDKMDETWAKVDSFQRCVWAAKIDSNFTTQLMYNATNGTATGGLQVNLFDSHCGPGLSKFNRLDPSEFNCDAIAVCEPVCDFSVNGNKSITRPVWDAGCKIEYYVHSSVFGTFISILAFVLMNISRWVFLRGARAMFWRHFSTGDFNYLASSTEQGEMLHPLDVKYKGKSMKEVVRDELHRTVKKFERMGVFTVALAGLINIPWIILLIYVSNTVQFINVADRSDS
jgi:hypothetical protein